MYALEGVVVADFGQYLAGPFGPMIMSDLGADVIKVEPVTGDAMRLAGKPFFGCQRGKRSLAVDLKAEEGLSIARVLVARSDIVHHNMTKGVADRLGIGYAACRAVNPAVVYCNTYAYGRDGPLSHFGGLDPLYQASAGLEYDAGPVREGNPPLYYRFGMCDAANAMLSTIGCLAALYRLRRDAAADPDGADDEGAGRDEGSEGRVEGQELWTSLLDAGAVCASDALLVDGVAVERPQLDVGQHGFGPGYRLYETQDGWIQIAAVTPRQSSRLHTVLGLVPEGAGEGADADGDEGDEGDEAAKAPASERRAAREARLADAFRARTALSWSRLLDDAGVPNEIPVDTRGGDAVLFDADNERLGLVAEYKHPIMGRMRQFGTLVDLSATPGRIAGPPPLVGEHTRDVLAWLGYSESDITRLKDAGVVTWPDDSEAYRTRWAV